MPSLIEARPELDVWLYKTISRDTMDGKFAVSGRYQGKDEYIDLTPFLNHGSSVRTSKSVRQPAGGFSITFADQPNVAWDDNTLESMSGLIEPMDLIEIRMWGGIGPRPTLLPIVMRGFVSEISRSRIVGDDGRPQRTVTVTGQDFGKIWQMLQVLALSGYKTGKLLLTTFALFEQFGFEKVNTMPAAEFVKKMVSDVINKHLDGFMPDLYDLMPRKITVGDSVLVKHGVVNGWSSLQEIQGSVYHILSQYGDVGIWNELYTEDREDGVHLVYRPIPAFLLSMPDDRDSAKIQDDAPDPLVATIPDYFVKSIVESRSDADVANFFWINGQRFDLIDDIIRKTSALQDGSATLENYPNAAPKFYGDRPMYAQSHQGRDEIKNMGGGLPETEHEDRSDKQVNWIQDRRRIMIEMNKDNVVYESGTAVIKGGLLRNDSKTDLLKAGDYALFINGAIKHAAYVHQIDHDFMPFQSYTSTIHFDRGEGFAMRAAMEGSPWLSEQASNRSGS